VPGQTIAIAGDIAVVALALAPAPELGLELGLEPGKIARIGLVLVRRKSVVRGWRC
jgi:hypothetical protein